MKESGQKFFLDDSLGIVVTYEDLIHFLTHATEYAPCKRFKRPDEFLKNLLLAITRDLPITLIDPDLTDAEMSNYGEERLLPSIPKTNFLMKEFVEYVRDSKTVIEIYTSGTTGKPKTVKHSIASLTKTVNKQERYADNIWGMAYSLAHMAGLQVFFQALFNKNMIINLFNKPRHFILEQISKYSVTHLSATPTFYRLLLPFESELNSVLHVTVGGEKSDAATYKLLQLIFPRARIKNIYASTEAGFILKSEGDVFLIPDLLKSKIIICENELLLHYSLLGAPQNFFLDNEFYHTGDLVNWIDGAQTKFRFAGRKDEILNIGGYKVTPSEVETAIHAISGVLNAVVYGRKNSILGTILCADVVIAKGASVSELEIRRSLGELLQNFKIPRIINFVDCLEVTRTGKIKRR